MIINESLLSSKFTKDFSEAHYLFHIWRAFDLCAACFLMLGIVFSTLSYEMNYAKDRTYSNCNENDIHTEIFRYFTALTSLISLVFMSLRYYYKDLWLTSLHRIDNIRIGGTVYRRDSTRRRRQFIMDVLIILIFPYPWLEFYIHVPLRHNFHTISTCYTAAELLYCLMLLRFFYVLRAIANYSRFQDEMARVYCREYKVRANFMFSIKCLLINHPWELILFIALFNLFFSAMAYRVFERPLDAFSKEYYSKPMTAIWYMLENVSTLGYGELYPYSYPARTVSVLAYLAGAILFALMIIKLQDSSNLNDNEIKVFESVLKSKIAASVVRLGITYLIVRNKKGLGHPISIKLYFDLRRAIEEFKDCREEIDKSNVKEKGIERLRNEIEKTKMQVKVCNMELDRFIKYFTQHYCSNKKQTPT